MNLYSSFSSNAYILCSFKTKQLNLYDKKNKSMKLEAGHKIDDLIWKQSHTNLQWATHLSFNFMVIRLH